MAQFFVNTYTLSRRIVKVSGLTLETVFILYSCILPYIVARLVTWQKKHIFSTIFPGWQPHQMVQMHDSISIIRTLMVKTETVSGTFMYLNCLMWLLAPEDFIEFWCHESFKTYMKFLCDVTLCQLINTELKTSGINNTIRTSNLKFLLL